MDLLSTESVNNFTDQSFKRAAKTAGLLYIIFIITYATSQIIQSHPIVTANVNATVRNILASITLFRIGFVMELISAVFFLLSAWALYMLLKSVNKSLALLFVLLNLAGVAIECVSTLSHFATLLLLNNADYMKVFQIDQREALAILFLNLGRNGEIIAMLFYGVWLFPLGYLIIKSGFLPKILGILLIADGISVLTIFFQSFIFPGYEVITYPLYPIMFIAEFSLALWLLIKGVKINEVIEM